MLIIVEGPDCAGKSTLAARLSDRLNIAPWHRGPPTEHPLDEYETPLLSYRPGTGQNIVCDRWHVGEWVYPNIVHRHTDADDAAWWHIEMFLAARGAIVVYVLPDLRELVDCVSRRGDDYVELAMLEDIRREFVRLTNHGVAETDVCLTYPDDAFLEQVLSHAEVAELDAAEIEHAGSYIGSPNPTALFVGDRDSYDPPYPPAFGPYKATSGHWMLETFAGDIDAGFANVGEEDIPQLWRSICEPRVVALGRVAQRELSRAGVPHGAIPHPQYVRRFHHRERRWYIDLAIKAATRREDLVSCRP